MVQGSRQVPESEDNPNQGSGLQKKVKTRVQVKVQPVNKIHIHGQDRILQDLKNSGHLNRVSRSRKPGRSQAKVEQVQLLQVVKH